MSALASTTNCWAVALRILGVLFVVAGLVRFVQTAGFAHRLLENGDYVLLHYRSPMVLTLSGIGLLVMSLVLPRVRSQGVRRPE